MSEMSVFMEKEKSPTNKELEHKLGDKIELWQEIRNYAFEKYPNAVEEWNFPGKKYGWSFRVKDKKRAIIYLLPREGFFKTGFVFGQKAMKEIISSEVKDEIKTDLQEARVYAEGRGVLIPVNDSEILSDIKRLIDIKLAH